MVIYFIIQVFSKADEQSAMAHFNSVPLSKFLKRMHNEIQRRVDGEPMDDIKSSPAHLELHLRLHLQLSLFNRIDNAYLFTLCIFLA